MVESLRHLKRHGDAVRDAADDLAVQRRGLLAGDAFLARDWDGLRHYPRFARAMALRAERLAANYRRDQEHQATLAALAAPLRELEAATPGLRELSISARRYASMLEELRVSLFAQQLGTSQPVSVKRLQAQWLQVRAWHEAGGGRDRDT